MIQGWLESILMKDISPIRGFTQPKRAGYGWKLIICAYSISRVTDSTWLFVRGSFIHQICSFGAKAAKLKLETCVVNSKWQQPRDSFAILCYCFAKMQMDSDRIQMSKATLAGRWCEMKQSQFFSPPCPKTSCNSSPTSRTSGTLSLVFPEPPAPWRRLEPGPVTGVRDGYITGNAVKQPRQIDTRDVCFSRPVNNQLKTSYIILPSGNLT